MIREKLTHEQFMDALTAVQKQLQKCIEKKGMSACASQHEILGILHEEFSEYEIEVRANDCDKGASELLDIAVGAIFGYASIKAGTVGWK